MQDEGIGSGSGYAPEITEMQPVLNPASAPPAPSASNSTLRAAGIILAISILIIIAYFILGTVRKTAGSSTMTQSTVYTGTRGNIPTTSINLTTLNNKTVTYAQLSQAIPGNWSSPGISSFSTHISANSTMTGSSATFNMPSKNLQLVAVWTSFNNHTAASTYMPYVVLYYNKSSSPISTGTVGNATYYYYTQSNSPLYGNLTTLYAIDGKYVIDIYTGGTGEVPATANLTVMKKILSYQLSDLNIK